MRLPTSCRVPSCEACAHAPRAGPRAVPANHCARRQRAWTVSRARFENVKGPEVVEDYYELLGVPKNASESEIKRQYRAMQRKFHPDIAGEQGREMSSKINHAYDVLMDRDARIAFDGVHKKAGFASGSLQRTEGLAGPLNERAVPLGEVQFEGITKDAAVDWLQQWGTSITFGCEMPFPSPLQCDQVPDGVRFAVITARGGRVSSLGELYLEIDPERLESEQVASVAVTRVSKVPDQALPGEREILKALKNALRYKKRHASGDGIQAGGWFGALLSGSLGMLPLVNFGDQDTGYDSYRIPKRCSMSEHAKETERSA